MVDVDDDASEPCTAFVPVVSGFSSLSVRVMKYFTTISSIVLRQR
jgi:hypothetical protein